MKTTRKSRPIVTILTDFGLADYFVGAMKGVILTRNPKANLVDITHEIPPQDVATGAFTLLSTYRYFPPGTIHLAVVDPGVGSTRRPIVVQAANQYFVGPDNGLFSLVIDRVSEAVITHSTNPDYFLPEGSSTFHGRDIFAPVAAALTLGVEPHQLGPTILDPVRLQPEKIQRAEDGSLIGCVIHVDHFGNCVTNLPWSELKPLLADRPFRCRVRNLEINRLVTYYSEAADPREPFLIAGSAGFLEISLNRASASRELSIGLGEPVILSSRAPIADDR